MKIFYSYDNTTKLYLEDIHVEAEPIMQQADSSTFKVSSSVYVQPASTTDIQPIGFNVPKWNGTKWVEAGDHVVIAALKKEALFCVNNKKTLEYIAVLEAQQTPRLLRGAALSDIYSVNKLKILEAQITALRKTLV